MHWVHIVICQSITPILLYRLPFQHDFVPLYHAFRCTGLFDTCPRQFTHNTPNAIAGSGHDEPPQKPHFHIITIVYCIIRCQDSGIFWNKNYDFDIEYGMYMYIHMCIYMCIIVLSRVLTSISIITLFWTRKLIVFIIRTVFLAFVKAPTKKQYLRRICYPVPKIWVSI